MYTVAFGAEYHFELVAEWARGIRAAGFTGDVIVLSDREFDIPTARTIVCGWMTPSQLWKAAIKTAIDCREYDKILFLDSDIPMLQNPNLFFELEGILIPLEPITIRKSGLNATFLKVDELEKYGEDYSFNAGTMLMPGYLADKFLTEFESVWSQVEWRSKEDFWPQTKTYKGQMYDQGILQAMICRKMFSVMPEIMPKSFIGFPAWGDGMGCIALHLCGLQHNSQNKKSILDYMVMLRDPTKAAEVISKMKSMANPLVNMEKNIEIIFKNIVTLLNEVNALTKKVQRLEQEKEVMA